MALVAVIAVTAVVAVSCTKSSGGSDKPTAAPTTSGAPTSDFASANDTGPVSVITEDPSCAPWMPILNTLADSQKNGWDQRDPSIPADLWDQTIRTQFQTVGTAMRNASDQAVAIVKITKHRVMRELYQQFIAYARAYADSINTYTANDDQLALTAIGAGEVLSNICQAITYGSAAARAPLTPSAEAPTHTVELGSADNPKRFLLTHDPVCSQWEAAQKAHDANPAFTEWIKTDSNPPASQWTPEQRAATDAVIPVMTAWADQMEELGRNSSNPTFQDIAMLGAVYQRAYIQALSTYTKADYSLYQVALLSPGIILGACRTSGA
ncbi:hypothetical protein QN239_09625 [Mycolicibacterium sp. Y3]